MKIVELARYMPITAAPFLQSKVGGMEVRSRLPRTVADGLVRNRKILFAKTLTQIIRVGRK
jgi:hypothetical protein